MPGCGGRQMAKNHIIYNIVLNFGSHFYTCKQKKVYFLMESHSITICPMPGCGGRQIGYIKAEEHKENDAKGVFYSFGIVPFII